MACAFPVQHRNQERTGRQGCSRGDSALCWSRAQVHVFGWMVFVVLRRSSVDVARYHLRAFKTGAAGLVMESLKAHSDDVAALLAGSARGSVGGR